MNFGKQILPDHLDNDTSKIKADAYPKHARKEEDTARHISRPRAVSNLQKFVDALNAVLVIRTNESKCDNDASQDGSDGQLGVNEAASLESLRRSSKKRGGTCFCRDDRCQYCPPGNRTAAEGELSQVSVPPARPEPDSNNPAKVSD